MLLFLAWQHVSRLLICHRFIHIPKTGGTTLNVLLETAADIAGEKFCEVSTKYMYSQHQSLLYHRCQIVSGEFDASVRFAFNPEDEADLGAVYDFTILRDPVKRAISQYEHHRYRKRFRGSWDSEFLQVTNNSASSLSHCDKVMHAEDCSTHEAKACHSLDDPTKCLNGGWCGVFQNHETEVRS